MKKVIAATLFLAAAISMSACNKAEVEKKPVIIEDSAQLKLEDPSELAESEDKTAAVVENNKKTEEGSGIKDTGKEDAAAEAKSNEEAEVRAAEEKAAIKAEEERISKMAEARRAEGVEAGGDRASEARSAAGEASETDEAMTIRIEGTEERVQGKRYKSKQGYEIVYDSERFKRESQENTDSFLAVNPDPTIYPYIYVNISRLEDTTVEKYSKELYKRLSKEGHQSVTMSNDTEKQQDSSKDAQVTVQTGYNWDSVIRKYRVIGEAGKIFLIETQYYLEAEEGYGARIQAMIDTFYIP